MEGQQAQVDASQLREREAGHGLQKYTSPVTAYIHVHSFQLYELPRSRPTYKNIHFSRSTEELFRARLTENYALSLSAEDPAGSTN